ncbi:SDR family oxidoreductase [Rhizosphaericola mali]|uniref:SDR family oxidoreductase n=1 Tax=Rhizosphaericola mali TaxID=2545455 RepID=A0A5P2FZ65_9BACT|nr:SDR family oxidoreductase [Rhizosphaericola mali]QES88505.1 SDR family oxidoreductase [Rhizosphaericola mali]
MQTKENSLHTLNGKRVVIMGGSNGLGYSTAKAADDEGAIVVIVSSNQENIDKALTNLSKASTGYVVDLRNESSIKDFFSTIGKFDHLVYTAAENIHFSNIEDTDIHFAKSYFDLRFWGAVSTVKYAVPHINPAGSISLTSGSASRRPAKGWSLMASILSAIEGFVRAMAVELAPIRVNSVVPGVIRTSLWSGLTTKDRVNLYNTVGDSLLVKRVGEPEEIAFTFLYLMKQQFGTGQNIVVDGGTVLV